MLGVDWAVVTAAGAFVAGAVLGAALAVRLTRAVWDGAIRAARALEDVDPPRE